MKYAKGDSVKLNRDYHVSKGTIPSGTKGHITEVLAPILCYRVNFNPQFANIKVPEFCLDKS